MHKKTKLISKRNNVFRMEVERHSYIEKKFVNQEDYIREVEVLSILKSAGINVPSIIKSEDNCLWLKDLGEITLLDWYESQERNNLFNEEMIYKLCSWLKNFYTAVYDFYNQQNILSDVNFKNFMIYEDEIYGIDFEQVCEGNVIEDAGKFSAYSLTYNPVMTEWKINFRNKFIDIMSKELNIPIDNIISAEKNELSAMEKRRGSYLMRYYYEKIIDISDPDV